MKKKSILQIIGIVTIINLASRLFGFIREVVIGYHFGTSYVADSVIVAYTIPNFLYIVVGGAVTTAFISVYHKIPTELEKEEFKRVIFSYLSLFAFILTAIFMIFTTEIIGLLFPGLKDYELALTADLFFFMAPAVLFFILSMWFTGVLNINKQFYRTSFVTLVNNVLFVVLAVLFFPLIGVISYALGALVGAGAMFILLFFYLKKGQLFTFSFQWKIEDKQYVRRFLKVSIPIILGGATLQFYFLLHRVFAASLDEGVIAALNYASKLVQLPQSILMTAVTTVIFPMLAKLVADNKGIEVNRLYLKGMKQLFIFIVPISVYVYFFSTEVVSFVFQYGAFDEQSTVITASMLKIFVIGMYAHAANLYVTRFYYAMERTTISVIIGIIGVFGINVLIVFALLDTYGASAIAWGTTIGAYFQLITSILLAIFMLKLKIGRAITMVKYVAWIGLLFVTGYLLDEFIQFPSALITIIISFLLFAIVTIVVGIMLKVINVKQLKSGR